MKKNARHKVETMNGMNRFLGVLILLSIVVMACGISIDYPFQTVDVGPLETEAISISPIDDLEVQEVSLFFGAGELDLSPGDDGYLIEGTAQYNVQDIAPKVIVGTDQVSIEQGNIDVEGLPNLDEVENRWNLEFGKIPMSLTIQAGAYQGRFEFGGLNLQSLTISDGASDVDLSFSEQNLGSMELLKYESGASRVSVSGLANANFKRMVFTSGAGDYSLDFSGELLQDAVVDIQSGFSNIELIIPVGIPAEVTVAGAMQTVSVDGNWDQVGSTYIQEGSGPLLRIALDLGAGVLEIRNP